MYSEIKMIGVVCRVVNAENTHWSFILDLKRCQDKNVIHVLILQSPLQEIRQTIW